MAQSPEPAAPIDQQAVAIDAQHAALDRVGIVDGEVVAWAEVVDLPRYG